MPILPSCLVASLLAGTSPQPGLETTMREYEQRRVTVDTIFVVDDHGGREIIPKDFRAQTGTGRTLEGPEFYAYVDRPDLASEYRVRSHRKKVLAGVGIGMFVAGTGLSLGSIAANGRTATALLGSGVGTMFVGLVPIGFALALTPHPIPPRDIPALVDEKNRRVRIELGLPERLEVRPVADAFGGGVRMSGRF